MKIILRRFRNYPFWPFCNFLNLFDRSSKFSVRFLTDWSSSNLLLKTLRNLSLKSRWIEAHSLKHRFLWNLVHFLFRVPDTGYQYNSLIFGSQQICEIIVIWISSKRFLPTVFLLLLWFFVLTSPNAIFFFLRAAQYN